MERKRNTKDIRKILIVCEGEKTEPNYFKAFPRSAECVVVIEPAGMVAESVVDRAIELRDDAEKQGNKYSGVWCVFDRDSNPRGNFNTALQVAASEGIKVAYSVEAFEIWYLLHFEYYNTGISREQYKEKLEGHLATEAGNGYKYEKNSSDMYKLLRRYQKRAIDKARQLLAEYDNSVGKIYDNNPSTTVHLLVQVLNEYLGIKL